MVDDARELPTLTDDQLTAVTHWVRAEKIGGLITDVEALTGGTQNIVVRLRVDGRPLVLRRPPLHPRPTSDETMLREIAVLRTLAGTGVAHPEFVAGCADLSVLGVVFYLMEDVDGFNPGNEMAQPYIDDARLRHDVGPAYAGSLGQLGPSSGRTARSPRFDDPAPSWPGRCLGSFGCSMATGTRTMTPTPYPG